MNSFEINKIITAIILAVVIVLGVNKLADVVYNVKVPEDATYKVDKATEIKEISKNEKEEKDRKHKGRSQKNKAKIYSKPKSIEGRDRKSVV